MRSRGWIGAGWALAAVLALGTQADAGDVTVADAWIRQAPPGAMVLAGYMRLRNEGAQPQALVNVHADAFGSVMIHQTMMEGGVARMTHAAHIDLAPHASLAFAPGGLHLMLMDPKRPLRAGERVEMQLEFRDGRRLPVSFEVRK